jgi:hypothetical protein
MEFNRQALTYIFLLLPSMFVIALFAQGITKLSNNNPRGRMSIGFSVLLLILIAVAYVFFIR